MSDIKSYRRSLVVATSVLVLGIAASLAGNVQAISLEDSTPSAGAYISAIVWPLFLFGSIELLIHTPWMQVRRDALTKGATVILVAFVSLWESYWHLVHVLASYGYDSVGKHLGPLAVDAAMGLATLSLNRVGQMSRAIDVPATAPATTVTAPQPDVTETAVQGVGDEVEAWLAASGTMEDAAEVRPISVPPALVRSNEIKPESVPESARLMFKIWANADETDRPTASSMYALVAGDHDVSPRTVRRWYTAVRDHL